MKPISFLAFLVGGALFGFGLAYSTMIQPEVVLDFLHWHDFGLLLVLGGAVAVTMVTYQLAPRLLKRPLWEPRFETRFTACNRRTLIGAAIFGVGWGLSGVCPGPAIAGLGAGNLSLLWALAGIWAGAYVQGRFNQCLQPSTPTR